jgi:UDP-N-acetylmuramoyl-tripeptide--D-alanyl-D-alanine ligase
MNHPGEIAPLAALARPDIGIVTSVGWAHIEFFKDRAAVAREKAELTRVLGPEGIAVLNGDDGLVKAMASTTNARILFAGGDSGACCRYENLVCTEEGMCFRLITPRGDTDVKLRAHGRHMVANATLAAAAGYGVGLDVEAIRRGLELVKLPSNRFRVSRFREGWLVDDSYNASPDSTLAAFETLRLLPGNGRLVALLGTMGELGDYALELHREVGKKAGQLGFDVLFCLGPHATALVDGALQGGMDESRVDFFESHEGLAQRYASTALAGDRILVKGSRARRMETVVDLLNGEK